MSDANTPSASIVASARQESVTTDALGRKITMRRLLALDRLRLFKAVGAANSSNAPYFGMAMLAASVTQIDEWPAPFPSRESDVEMLVARLGDDGLEAVAAALMTDQLVKAIEETEAGARGKADAAATAHGA
jgi:hypothetical protein